MAKNYKERGETIRFVAATALVAGSAVLLDGLCVIPLDPAATGEEAVGYAGGVWDLPAVAASTANAGAAAYLTSGGQVTGTASGNVRIGRFWQALAASETIARVKINAT